MRLWFWRQFGWILLGTFESNGYKTEYWLKKSSVKILRFKS